MIKKETSKPKGIENQNFGDNKLITSQNSKKKKEKSLPWWVELLFVQIGLPDNLLIKILKAKKKSKEFIENEKKFIFTFFFIISVLAYFYPVVKHAKNKLNCEAAAKSYIIEYKDTSKIKKKELRMLSTNFCYGGEEVYELENIK